jgi:nucleoside-diphosphate-sugar epimerase
MTTKTMSKNNRILVAGAGGFIGGHLVKAFREDGLSVRAVDRKPISDWHQLFGDVENLTLDLKSLEACRKAAEEAALVYNLAADMGGMGFIELNKGACMLSVLINTHLLIAAKDAGVERFFFSSSACVWDSNLLAFGLLTLESTTSAPRHSLGRA